MALPAEQQLKYWGIASVTLFVLLWLLGDVLLPFVIAGAIAYVLDPVADRLERLGLGRSMSVLLISLALVLICIVVGLAIVPTLVRQTIGLVEAAPDYARSVLAFIDNNVPGGLSEGSPLSEAFATLAETVRDKGLALMNGVLTSALSIINVVAIMFIVPVVSVYLLIDWDRMIERVDDLLPRDHAPVLRQLAAEMDRTLASFIRGQGMVCLIQGTFYAVALMAAGLNFGLVVGLIAGLLSFIPFVGSITGGLLAIGLATFQFWGDWFHIILVAGIFFVGQVIEGNYLTPKLVGSSVGLHPVWLLLALAIFGALFGFVGMLVAVPVSAMIGVLVRFLVDQYKGGKLYVGYSGQPGSDDTNNHAE